MFLEDIHIIVNQVKSDFVISNRDFYLSPVHHHLHVKTIPAEKNILKALVGYTI